MVAAESADVPPPWDMNSGEELDDLLERRLSVDARQIRAALISYSAFLRFVELRSATVAAAKDAMPELANAYWLGWEIELLQIMPRMSDLTWRNFRRWAERFDPASIGKNWDEPPEQYIEAVAWIWTGGKVDGAMSTVEEWLIAYFRRVSEPFGLTDFLEIVTTFIPKVGRFGAGLVGVAGRAGQKEALPFYARLLGNPELPSEVRDEVEHWRDYCSSLPG
ncbi:hypothetical protein [Actinomadura pelletieri]|uniref:hypothetical protein n=1 Tax=Actinomadura pelletieri TaxID=111805 RepID=UPI0011C39F2A|nr:hypothetical protein [Actinomadura pelletieri]